MTEHQHLAAGWTVRAAHGLVGVANVTVALALPILFVAALVVLRTGGVSAGSARVTGPVVEGAWDHKPILKALVQSKRTFWTAVPDTGRKERIRFDIWSNIHYGYVGLSHGIPPTVLYQAQLMDGGNNSDADNLSVRLGFVLWVVHGRHLSAANVHNWIRIMMPAYRRIPGVVKPGWS